MITKSNKKDGKETVENKQIEGGKEEVKDSLNREINVNKFEFNIPRATDKLKN